MAHLRDDDLVRAFLDGFVAQTLEPGSGFETADSRTDEHHQTVNEPLWERELRTDEHHQTVNEPLWERELRTGDNSADGS